MNEMATSGLVNVLRGLGSARQEARKKQDPVRNHEQLVLLSIPWQFYQLQDRPSDQSVFCTHHPDPFLGIFWHAVPVVGKATAQHIQAQKKRKNLFPNFGQHGKFQATKDSQIRMAKRRSRIHPLFLGSFTCCSSSFGQSQSVKHPSTKEERNLFLNFGQHGKFQASSEFTHQNGKEKEQDSATILLSRCSLEMWSGFDPICSRHVVWIRISQSNCSFPLPLGNGRSGIKHNSIFPWNTAKQATSWCWIGDRTNLSRFVVAKTAETGHMYDVLSSLQMNSLKLLCDTIHHLKFAQLKQVCQSGVQVLSLWLRSFSISFETKA